MTEKEMVFSNDPELRFLGRELFSQHATRFECEKFIISNQSECHDYISEFFNRFYDIITEGKGYCSGQIADVVYRLKKK